MLLSCDSQCCPSRKISFLQFKIQSLLLSEKNGFDLMDGHISSDDISDNAFTFIPLKLQTYRSMR